MGTADLGTYHRRAVQLADAMKLCQDDLPAYASAAGLLAVHSAISYSDAVLIGLGGKRPRGEDHRQAAAALKRACTQTRIDQRGIRHLETLLSAKAEIAYGERETTQDRIKALCITAERFRAWSEPILRRRRGD
ncbi:MAG TPA: hypothetical protein VE291_04775 [Terracidiphilus sp.]|jgi:hypothetical protein|nr:hypothetical protein [Terracidiphilus sp.]